MKYNNITLGKIEAAINKLGGVAGMEAFLQGKTKIIPNMFKFWRSIRFARFKQVFEPIKLIVAELHENGFVVDCGVSEILEYMPRTTEDGQEFEMFIATTEELTGHESCTLKQVLDSIKEKGYETCPADLVPQIRWQYKDQPQDEFINIAMEYVVTPKSRGTRYNAHILQLCHTVHGIRLSCSQFDSDKFTMFHKKWLFVRRK